MSSILPNSSRLRDATSRSCPSSCLNFSWDDLSIHSTLKSWKIQNESHKKLGKKGSKLGQTRDMPQNWKCNPLTSSDPPMKHQKSWRGCLASQKEPSSDFKISILKWKNECNTNDRRLIAGKSKRIVSQRKGPGTAPKNLACECFPSGWIP